MTQVRAVGADVSRRVAENNPELSYLILGGLVSGDN